MKILDIRKTQSGQWWADVLLNPSSVIPLSTSIVNCSVDELVEFALSDERHIAIANCIVCGHPKDAHQPMCLVMIDNGVACECAQQIDPRTPAQIERDTMDKEWKEVYSNLRSGL